jgi:hypothetical protein
MKDGPIDISTIKIGFPNAGKYSENDPLFIEELRLLVEELSTPGRIREACVHETGHLIFFRSLGKFLKIPPNKFCFVCPYVAYELNRHNQHEFHHAVAATSVPFDEDNLDYTDELLKMLANACFAGGVFAHELIKGSLRGDAGDFIKFHNYYNSAIIDMGQPELLESQLIERAIERVTLKLQNTAFRKQALTKADELETYYFS